MTLPPSALDQIAARQDDVRGVLHKAMKGLNDALDEFNGELGLHIDPVPGKGGRAPCQIVITTDGDGGFRLKVAFDVEDTHKKNKQVLDLQEKARSERKPAPVTTT